MPPGARASEAAATSREARRGGPDDPLWYKDAIVYELHVRSFQDSTDDGIGDFPGLIQRLPYLADLGITAIWLLPFYPSPLRDDGYDIADYLGVHPDYGTLDDFQRFVDESHRLGLRVITELVLNHTSDQHAWFQRARRADPGTPEREFYVWSQTADAYPDARIIFQDFELSNWSWDPVAGAYYWHRFYSHQPDLNYDNPMVREAMAEVIEFWFERGVDGMRLDAVPYLIEREGTTSENLEQTHAVLRFLRRRIDRKFRNRMVLAEANQWPEDAAVYFGSGRESHMVFHFPLMPRLFMAVRQEDRLPIVDILAQTPPIPDECQWALFLRNHDELTLEMVSEEERVFMYHVYATDPEARLNLGIRRRLAPLLGNHRRRIELMNALLCSLPGTPVLYYGDEIGMGDNIYLGDRNGVRTPMQWGPDRNAGFSRADPQRLYLPLIIDDQYHHRAVHVEAQQRSPHSLLSWTKRLLALRKRHPAFARGTLEFLEPANQRVLGFVRRYAGEQLLVVANLSRFAQHTELDLRRFDGLIPVELFGRTRFPPVTRDPYPLVLPPHGFLWFELEDPSDEAPADAEPPEIAADWASLFDGRCRSQLEDALTQSLRRRPPHGRLVLAARVADSIALPPRNPRAYLVLTQVEFSTGEPETQLLMLEEAAGPPLPDGGQLVARLGSSGVLLEVRESPAAADALMELFRAETPIRSPRGLLSVTSTPALGPAPAGNASMIQPAPGRRRPVSQMMHLGGRHLLKLYSRIEPGTSPELEMGEYLTRRGIGFVPAFTGSLRYRDLASHGGAVAVVGVLQRFVPHTADLWERMLRSAEAALGRPPAPGEARDGASADPRAMTAPVPATADLLSPDDRDLLQQLGALTGRLHVALASAPDEPAFAPEPFSRLVQRSVYQRMRGLTVTVLRRLEREIPQDAGDLQARAAQAVRLQPALLDEFGALLRRPVAATRIRCHGNFHLGQILLTGEGLCIVGFGGESDRPVFERRLKHSPLLDLATLVRSLQYATGVSLAARTARAADLASGGSDLEARAHAWEQHATGVFLRAYEEEVAGTGLLPEDPALRSLLFRIYQLERVLYELGSELSHRPDWVRVPLAGLLRLAGS